MDKEWMPSVIAMLRKFIPKTIAQEIAGVQPMSVQPKFLTYQVLTEGWEKVCPTGHTAIKTNIQIAAWIEQQPVHMWKYIDLESNGKTYAIGSHFFVSDQLLTWLKMRWE
jgi:hypothetical protein